MDQIIDIGWSLAGIAGVGFLAFIAHRHHSGRAKLTPDERAALDREADREANIW